MGALSSSIQAGNPILLYGRHLTRRPTSERSDVSLKVNLFSIL